MLHHRLAGVCAGQSDEQNAYSRVVLLTATQLLGVDSDCLIDPRYLTVTLIGINNNSNSSEHFCVLVFSSLRF